MLFRSNLQKFHVYSPFKSPASPDFNILPEAICRTGLNLCFRQTSPQIPPKLPSNGMRSELFQDIPQNYNNSGRSSLNASPLFGLAKESYVKSSPIIKEMGIEMEDDEHEISPEVYKKYITQSDEQMYDIDMTQVLETNLQQSIIYEFNEDKNFIMTESKTTTKKCCNCKKSKCLKLYCECFAAGQSCEGCNCVGCHNLEQYENERKKAMAQIAKKNPKGFNRRMEINEHRNKHEISHKGTGCNCSKTGCLRNYCECFKMGVGCGPSCRCEGCGNFK